MADDQWKITVRLNKDGTSTAFMAHRSGSGSLYRETIDKVKPSELAGLIEKSLQSAQKFHQLHKEMGESLTGLPY